MSFLVKFRSLPKHTLWVSILSLVVIFGLSYFGCRLITDLIVNQAAKIEAERITTHLRTFFRRIDSKPVWQDPRSHESTKVFEKIFNDSTLREIEQLRALKVWDRNGRLVWPNVNHKARIIPRSFVFYKFESPSHDQIHNENFENHLAMETFVPLWQGGEKVAGKPDLVVEVYTQPQFLFGHLMNMDLIWVYSGIVGLTVYLIMLGAMMWTGRNREIAEKHATRLNIANRLANTVGSTRDPDTLFKTIVYEIRRAIPCERCVISTVDRENNRYTYWYIESDVEVERRNLSMGPDEWKGEGVYDTKRPLYIPNITEECWRVHERIAKGGIHTLLIIPVIQEDRCVAHINLSSIRVDAFANRDEEMLVSIAAHLGSAIRNATLYQTAQGRADRLTVLNELNREISENLKISDLFSNIASNAVDLLKADHSSIFLYDEDAREFHLQVSKGRLPYPSDQPRIVPWDHSIIAKVGMKSANIPDAQNPYLFWTDWARENGIHTFSTQPLKRQGRYIGLIICMSQKVGAFNQEDMDLLGSLAAQASVALENARLFGEEQQRADRMEVVGKITEAIGSTLEPKELFRTIIREVRRVVPCERCVIDSLDRGNQKPWYVESNLDIPLNAPPYFSRSPEWTQQVYTTKVLVNIPNLGDIQDSPRASFLAGAGFRSVLTAPILQDGKCIAHISFASTRHAAFSPEHEEFLTAISNHLGSAIRNASLHKEAQARAKRLEIVNSIARAVGSKLEPNELFKTIVGEIRKVISCERYVIRSYDQSYFNPWCIESEVEVPSRAQSHTSEAAEWIQEVRETKRPVNVPNFGDFPLSIRAKQMLQAGFQSVLSAPILQNGNCIGHITLASFEIGFFTSEHEEFLTAISGHLGSAIRNASLHKDAQARAKRLEIVNRIAQAIGSKLEPNELFKTIVREIRQVISCDRYVLASFDGKTYHPWHIESEIEVHPPKHVEIEGKAQWFQQVYEKCLPFEMSDLKNFTSSPRVQAFAEAGFRSSICTPIIQDGKCVAHLSLASTETEFFTSEHGEFLSSISGHLGSAIRNASLHKDAQARAKRLEIVNKIAQAVGSKLEPDELFKIIAKEIRCVIPCDRIVIESQDLEGMKIQQIHEEGGVHMGPPSPSHFRHGLISQEAYKKRRPLNIPDLLNSRWRESRHAKHGYRSALSVPILQRDQRIATIFLSSLEPEAFTLAHEELLSSIAAHLGPAIRNATLYQMAEERAERFSALNELGQQVAQSLDLEDVLQKVVGASAGLLQGVKSDIFIYDERVSAFKLRASYGQIPNQGVQIFKRGQGIIGVAGETGKGIIVPDILKEPRWVNTEWAKKHDLRGFIVVPIQINGKPFMVLNCFSHEADYFSENDLDLLYALASQATIAIKNASLFEETERKGSRLTTLVSATKQLTEGLDLSQVLNSIVQSAASLFEGESGVRLLEGDQLIRVGTTQGALPLMKTKSLNLTNSACGEVVQKGIPFVTSDVRTDTRLIEEHRKNAQDDRTGALLILPVKLGNRVLGTLNLFHRKGFVFDQESMALATSLADQAAIAIENARLHEEATKGLEFFRSVVDDNADAIIMQNPDRELIHWNKGAETLFGYTEEEAIGNSIDIIFTDDDTERRKRGEAVLKAGISRQYEGMRRKKNGSQVPVEVTVSPVKDDNGKVIAISSVFKDLTARKRAEEKILLALKEAKTASQAKSEFLSTMSHELRSPLNAVIGFSQLLFRDSQDPITRSLAPKIQDSGQYLLSMIEEILDLERIEAGKIRLKVNPVDINELVSEVVDSWHSRLPEGFCLRLQPDQNCGEIGCDLTRIKQILNNLIDNAIKYSPDGGTICASTLSKPDEVQVSVSDRGVGINPEAMEMIFDRFQQLESGFTRRAGGLGIGLSLARELIELQGGRIWVESNQKEGSTFTFALPRTSVTAQDSSGLIDAAETAVEMGNPWDDRTILIVDDLEHYHEYMRLLMASAPRMISAYNGLEAIDAARRESPDLILMDLRMPIMDGFDAIRHLKSDPLTKDIPIVAVTAQAADEDKDRSERAGAEGFVTKPVDIPMFKAELRRVLGVLA